MRTFIEQVVTGIRSVADILEAYVNSGSISQENKWKLTEIWEQNYHVNDLIDYAREKAKEGDILELYKQCKEIHEDTQRIIRLRDANRKMFYCISFTGEPNGAWDESMAKRWGHLDMDFYNYLIERYDWYAHSLIADVEDYWKDNGIEPPKD